MTTRTEEAPEAAAAGVAVDRIVMLPASKLRRHPSNPRPEPSEADVAGLMESIAATEQHQPCLVRPLDYDWEGAEKKAAAPGSLYQLVVGHRRAKACAVLGRDVACIVQPMNDEEALAVMLADNLQRTDPDPISEAAAVVEMMKLEGMDYRATAAVLGKSLGWVATRTVLAQLDRDVAAKLKERGWPIACLEEYARLAPEVQKACLDETRYADSVEDLRAFLGRKLRLIGKAPWDVDDVELVPAAGSCSACPKTSLSTPGLFEGEVDGEPKDVRRATCRDFACWELKAGACQARVVAGLLEKNPDALVLDEVHGHAPNLAARYPALSAKVQAGANFETFPRREKGAVPAVLLQENGVVKSGWARPFGWAPPAAKGAAAKAKGSLPEKKDRRSDAERLKDSKALIAQRRAALLVDLVREAAAKVTEVPVKVVASLVGAYGVDGLHGKWGAAASKERAASLELYEAKPKDWAALVWSRMKREVGKALDRQLPDALEAQAAEANVLAGALGIDLAGVAAEILKQIPDPKWWASSGKPKKGPTPPVGKPGKPPKWYVDQQRKKKAAKAKGSKPAKAKAGKE